MGSALFDLLPELNGGICFGLPNAPPHTQARRRFNGGTTPVFTLVFGCYSLVATFL
jgi:hypothetical protein